MVAPSAKEGIVCASRLSNPHRCLRPTHAHAHAHAHTHAHTHAHAHTLTHAHAHTLTRSHAHTLTRTKGPDTNVRTYISLESVRFADRYIKNVDKKIDTGFFGGNKEHGMCWYDHGSNSSLIQVGNDDDFFITRSNSDYLYNNALYTKWTSRHPVRPQL